MDLAAEDVVAREGDRRTAPSTQVLKAVYSFSSRADEVIDSTAEDVVARVKDITAGDGAYSALDPIAGNVTTQVHVNLQTDSISNVK